jgi:hypothetical protein
MNMQFGLRSLFFVLVATAMLLSLFVAAPSLTGFDMESSRRFLFAGLLGGTFAGACITLVREHFLSTRYALRVIIAAFISTPISYWILSLYSKQYEQVGSWPGMAILFLLPATAIVSAIGASCICLCLPKAWVGTLESTFFQPAQSVQSPTASFGVAWIVIAFFLKLRF